MRRMSDQSPETGSITACIDGLRSGDEDAARTLWERYYARLVGLARGRLRRPGAVEDEEDAAASAIKSLCRGLQQGHCPGVTDRDNLWRLLVEITACKAYDQIEPPAVQEARRGTPLRGRRIRPARRRGPTGDFACEASEQLDRLIDALRDPVDRRVAWMRMEGYTRGQIAEELDCHERTVANRLKGIRLAWVEAGLATPSGEAAS